MKAFINHFVTALIGILLAAYAYYLCFINHDYIIRATGFFSVGAILLSWFFYVNRNKKQAPESAITEFALINRDGESEKQWGVSGAQSFLIGKGGGVDMDLTDNDYAEYIANEHAVLNFAGGYWYIEDLDSVNGVGIKKNREEYAFKIKPLTSYRVDVGDVIYIGRAKILVK